MMTFITFNNLFYNLFSLVDFGSLDITCRAVISDYMLVNLLFLINNRKYS